MHVQHACTNSHIRRGRVEEILERVEMSFPAVTLSSLEVPAPALAPTESSHLVEK